MFTKKTLLLGFSAILGLCVGFAEITSDDDYDIPAAQIVATDVYRFRMRLHIPRIYDNNQSRGYRKYQTQTVQGEAYLSYDKDGTLVDVTFGQMVNKTQKLSNGGALTYPNTQLNTLIYPRFNAIGSNKTGKFKTASICFYLAAEPNYNKGGFDEDNALYVQLAGKGTLDSKKKHLKKANGNVAGTLGCGCMAYGHKSPTRKITFYGPGDEVDDVAAVFGNWHLTYLRTDYQLFKK